MEKFLKKIIQRLPDHFFAIDKDGKVIFWSDKTEKFTGIKKENILGKGDYIYSEIFYGYKRPTLVDLVLNPDEEAENKYYTNFHRSEDGAVEGEAYNSELDYYDWGKAVPIYNEDNEIEAVITISRDMGDRIRIERQAKELLKRYETIFVSSPDAIVCFDKNHIVYDVNESFLRIFKYEKDECLGKDVDDLVVPKRHRRKASQVTAGLFENGAASFEDIRYTKYEEPIVVSVQGIMMTIEDELIGGYAIYTDITDKTKYKNELESTNMELKATIEQLVASEEELRAQYDEIQEYSEKNLELKQKYEIAIEATNSFIWEIDVDKRTIEFSKNFIELVGHEAIEKESIRDITCEVVHEEDRDLLLQQLEDYIEYPVGVINAQTRIIDKDGLISWHMIKGKGIKNSRGLVKSVHGVMVDITELRLKDERIEYLAIHDPLTKLYNRRKLSMKLLRELENNKKGALILLDIDDFKNINDVLGHAYGDKVLRYIGKLIKNLCPRNAVPFRFGGDEFLILVKEGRTRRIKEYAQGIKDGLKETITIDGIENNITVTMGIVEYPIDGDNIDELLIKVDIAMYNAKISGKNRFLFFNENMKDKFNRRVEIEGLLRNALRNDGFLLLYQPIIETNTGRISSFEALLRIKNSNIPPVEFIPIAEETGLILPIGKWVIKEAVKQISQWIDRGKAPLPVSVNLSPRQFYDESLVSYTRKTLSYYDVHPSLLEIEITENIFAEEKLEVINILNKFKSLGIVVSLDDFGTGYSSLNYLTFMPIDKIKIDKSLKDKFIVAKDRKVMDSLISLAHGLGLKVVVEGVEKAEEYKEIKRVGSDYMQGFLFSKPICEKKAEQIYYRNYLNLLLEEED